MSFTEANMYCPVCGERYYTARPEAFVGDRCTRESPLLHKRCTGQLRLHPNYVERFERGWIEDGLALAELYANHHGAQS